MLRERLIGGHGIRALVGSVGRVPRPPGLSMLRSTPVPHEQGAGGCTACATHPQPPASATRLGCGCPVPGRGPHAGDRHVLSPVGSKTSACRTVLRGGGLPRSSLFVFSKAGTQGGERQRLPALPRARICLGWALGIPVSPGCDWETSKKRGLWGQRAARGVLWHPNVMPICVNNRRAVRGN